MRQGARASVRADNLLLQKTKLIDGKDGYRLVDP